MSSTSNEMARGLKLLTMVFWLLVQPAVAQTPVEEIARRDQLSGKLYQALGPLLTNSIRNAHLIDFAAELSNEYELDGKPLTAFIIYVGNYTRDELTIEQVLYRYPHYNRDSIQDDFNRLVASGLLIKDQSMPIYRVTSLGDQVLISYWHLRVEQVKTYDEIDMQRLEAFKNLLVKVVSESSKNSPSTRCRIRSRPENFDAMPLVVQVTELAKEYTAFINDASHYKYDRLIALTNDPKWQRLKLTPLAKELMSATRSGRVYDLSVCYRQSNWRVGPKGCDAAVQELVQLGLVQRNGGDIFQTIEGAVLSTVAEDLADKTLYSAWTNVSVAEYNQFVEGINWLLENLEP